MLKQRVITALILASLLIAAVLLLPTGYLAIVLGWAVAIGGREWAKLSGIDIRSMQLVYALFLLICLAGVYYYLPETWLPGVMAAAIAWWLYALFSLTRYRTDQDSAVSTPIRALQGLIVLVPAWLALVSIHRILSTGPGLLLFVLILIWSADVGAYFAGHRWGRHKLAPQVSPGKTREGVYGATAAALICGLILAWWLDVGMAQLPLILLLCLVTMLSSIVGDLFESLLKRQQGLKDSGTLLPGHGGMLDRIDSLTAAAPVFLFGLILLGVVQ